MATIVTRASNGAPLTHEQMDQNLTNLNDQGVATEVRVDNIEQELNGKVDSVNNQTGAVELEASDIPFQPTAMLTANNVQAAVEEAQDKANARWLDGLPAAMAGAADGYLLKVTGTPGNYQVVAAPGSGYVTSEGVNSRGNYRAWSDGTLEQWGFRALFSALSNGASQAGSFDLPVSISAGSTVRAVATACRANYAGPAFAVELRLLANPIGSAMPSVFFNAYAGGGAAAGDGFYWYVWSK